MKEKPARAAKDDGGREQAKMDHVINLADASRRARFRITSRKPAQRKE